MTRLGKESIVFLRQSASLQICYCNGHNQWVKIWITSSHTLFARFVPLALLCLSKLEKLAQDLPIMKRWSLRLIAILRSLTVLNINIVSKLLNIAGKSVSSYKETVLRNKDFLPHIFMLSSSVQVFLGHPHNLQIKEKYLKFTFEINDEEVSK